MSKWENEKMKNRFVRYVLIVLLCGLCHTAAFAYGYDQNAQSQNWGYQPVYNNTVASSPSYQFRTTSVYINSSGDSESENPLYGPSRSPRGWGRPGGNPIGEVDDPVPVGDTPWLLMLLLAAGYIGFRYIRQRKKIAS